MSDLSRLIKMNHDLDNIHRELSKTFDEVNAFLAAALVKKLTSKDYESIHVMLCKVNDFAGLWAFLGCPQVIDKIKDLRLCSRLLENIWIDEGAPLNSVLKSCYRDTHEHTSGKKCKNALAD